jgi:hypothetical protein
MRTLRKWRYHLDPVFLIVVCLGSKFRTSVLENVGLQVPARYIRDFSLFISRSSSKNCPSARCASAAVAAYRDVDVFGTGTVSLNHFYNDPPLLLK